MALLRVDVISKALDMATSFMAVLPDEGNLQKTRVVYLLHGLTDNCTGTRPGGGYRLHPDEVRHGAENGAQYALHRCYD